MIFKKTFIALLYLLLTQIAGVDAQQIIPIYNSKNLVHNTLKIKSDSGSLNITAYNAATIELTFCNQQTLPNPGVANSTSRRLNIRVTQNLDDIFFATDSLWVIVNKYDSSVRFLKKQTEELLAKCNSYFLNNEDKAISFTLSADDLPSLFNGGKEIGKVSKCFRSRKKLKTPVLVSPKGYVLLIENPSKRKVKASATAGYQIKFDLEVSTSKTFFFFSGTTDEIKRNINLTQGFRPQ